VRITVQLVDVVTNRQIWGETYKGKLDDIFEIQEQVRSRLSRR
jgi:TolB-like protein